MSRSYAEEEQDITNALLYDTLQKNLNWWEIADKFDVNYQCMLTHKNERGDCSNCDNHNKFLTSDQETDLIHIFENMKHRELHCRYRMISNVVNFILANAHNDSETSSSTVDKNWTQNFFKHNSEFCTWIFKSLFLNWKWAHDSDAILNWYSELLHTIAHYEVISDDIWNFNETEFSIEVEDSQRIITKIQNQKI